MKIDFISLWNECHAKAQAQKKILNREGNFWDKKEHAEKFFQRVLGDDQSRIRYQLDCMSIPVGSSVLDIGAGPGTLAVPLACLGHSVTVVEPSNAMRSAMQRYRRIKNAPEIFEIPKRWEDVSIDEAGRHDVVIASLSLALDDIGTSLLKMDAAAKQSIHLFWFLHEPNWTQVSRELWPKIYGGEFYSEPNADLLWNCLFQLGISANLTVEKVKRGHYYSSMNEALLDFSGRLGISPDGEFSDVLVECLKRRVVKSGDGFLLPGDSETVHIWWRK